MIPSYPSIYALGHKFLGELFSGPVIIEEKIDGSQFSFGFHGGWLKFRSKGQEIHPGGPEKMFNNAITAVQRIHQERGLVPGWTYRAEYLSKCKHNCLTYGEVPHNFLVLFDVMTDPGEHYLDPRAKFAEARTLQTFRAQDRARCYGWDSGLLQERDWSVAMKKFLDSNFVLGVMILCVIVFYSLFWPFMQDRVKGNRQ